MIGKAFEFDHDAKILKNNVKSHWIDKITNFVNKEESITILGLSFKPNSDNIRDSPVLSI